MIARAAALLLLLVSHAASGASAAADLRTAMAVQLAEQELQGAVWSTLAPDGTVAADAAGVKDSRSGVTLRADDRVHVGSIAKSLLATGVLRLVSERRLALDTPVSDVLPSIAFDNPWTASDPIRIRHLLDHTAGLDDARLAQIFSLEPTADTPLAAAFRAVLPLRVRSRPGSRHSYSNMGYTLLGMTIEAVTGERYETWLDAHLLQPLGMHESTFGYTTQATDPRLAMGHFENGVAQAAVPTYLRPATQFATTASDMGRFARFLMSDGRIDGVPFIDAALLRAMGRPEGTEASDAGLHVGYGLGLATRDRHGAVGRCHGGSTVGYRAMLCLFPASQRAFFIAVNADAETADYGRFDRILIDALQLPAAEPALASGPASDADAWSGYYIPAPNRFASFEWLDTTFGFARLHRDAAGLHFTPLQSGDVLLQPVARHLYRASDRIMASHVLLTTRDGTRAIGTGLQTYEQVSPWKLVALWISLIAGLLGALWLLLAGLVRLVRKPRAVRSHPAFLPFLGIAVLALPLPFFFRQSFLQLGDPTLASVLLASVTLLLPITMIAGLSLAVRQRCRPLATAADAMAMLAVLQFTMVLAWWGLLPLRLWA